MLTWASFLIIYILFVGSPYLPDSILLILDNIFVRIGTVLLILWAITTGPIVGVMIFLLVVQLYIERNNRKITNTKIRLYSELATKISAGEGDDGLGNDGRRNQLNIERETTVKEESESQNTVPVLPFDIPSLGNIWRWNPEDECRGNEFKPVAPTINTKQPTKTIDGGSKTWNFFLKKDLAGRGLGGGRVD
jgi:hypothetical protein